jgi:hypothetical protein
LRLDLLGAWTPSDGGQEAGQERIEQLEVLSIPDLIMPHHCSAFNRRRGTGRGALDLAKGAPGEAIGSPRRQAASQWPGTLPRETVFLLFDASNPRARPLASRPRAASGLRLWPSSKRQRARAAGGFQKAASGPIAGPGAGYGTNYRGDLLKERRGQGRPQGAVSGRADGLLGLGDAVAGHPAVL